MGTVTIAIDHGTVRTGVSITKSGGIASPYSLPILTNYRTHAELAELILKIIRRENVSQIVVGLPLRKQPTKEQGLENTQTAIVRSFVRIFANFLADRGEDRVRVFLYDERFSSKMAKSMGGRELLDSDSAGVVLANFVEEGQRGGLQNLEEVNIDYANCEDSGGKGDIVPRVLSRKERRKAMMEEQNVEGK